MKELSDEHVPFWFAEHFGDRLSTVKPRRETKKADGDDTHNHRAPAKATSKSIVSADRSPAKPKPLKPLRFYLNLHVDAAKPYLHRRGVTDETIARYGLGLCRKGVLASYAAIPIYRYPCGEQENPLAYIGRWPGEDFDQEEGRPRYKLLDGFEASRVIYGVREALEASSPTAPLIAVDGPFKVYHLAQCGFPNTVSPLTSALSEEQAHLLGATARSIVLFFDGNEAGYAGMRRAAGRLITKSYVRAVKLPEGSEPDHLTYEQLHELLDFAR